MGKPAIVSVWINEKEKREIELIFDKLGLTTSTAIKLFFKQVLLRRALPFDATVKDLVPWVEQDKD
jgi:DNA-damage-inducible protein J